MNRIDVEHLRHELADQVCIPFDRLYGLHMQADPGKERQFADLMCRKLNTNEE